MMKCEHCGKNEATFYYRTNINGVVKEVHLCQDCAAELGYAECLRSSFRPMHLFSDSFEPFFGALGSHLLTEFPSPVGEPVPEQPKPLVDEIQQAKLRAQRQRNALEAQLQSAIEAEDYETAAKLRDELKKLSA